MRGGPDARRGRQGPAAALGDRDGGGRAAGGGPGGDAAAAAAAHGRRGRAGRPGRGGARARCCGAQRLRAKGTPSGGLGDTEMWQPVCLRFRAQRPECDRIGSPHVRPLLFRTRTCHRAPMRCRALVCCTSAKPLSDGGRAAGRARLDRAAARGAAGHRDGGPAGAPAALPRAARQHRLRRGARAGPARSRPRPALRQPRVKGRWSTLCWARCSTAEALRAPYGRRARKPRAPARPGRARARARRPTTASSSTRRAARRCTWRARAPRA